MKHFTRLFAGSCALLLSVYAFGAPEGTANIKATLEVIKPYDIQTTPLAFGERALPQKGSETITIKPNTTGASQITIGGTDGEATVSLVNRGNFTLTGGSSGDRLAADAFFDGNKDTTKVTLVEGRAKTSVGGQVKLTQSTAPDNYTGTVTLNVTKNI